MTIAASAAIFSGGSSLALQPIIRRLFSGWAMAESIAFKLYYGRKVYSIYKNNSTWITDFDGQEALKKAKRNY